ncbi:SRPBCC domain-containing protein [Maribacter cobaltidurans]|uniref:Polyketide cyclase n=1 Tax=Maribacter cobaltidurans TaxID=1178778 RepID=A0A223V6V6_9FLAO|nr:SRPBCC domain-containing protein [Maribacter cobaltidurans]ASV30738.1 polyketide cyclase [Maribacter cobaltidurans]GGD81380.1 activator of HSP90 ATPase [Maribacter cobaltidurans]
MQRDVNRLTAQTLIKAPIEMVWELWTNPVHIGKWNNMSEEWHTPVVENDLRAGGKLYLRMETKDGSEGFDYICNYDEIVMYKKIAHTTSDNRKTTITFVETEEGVRLTEAFEPESETPLDVQQEFCQSILNNFKHYAESTV